VKKLILAALVVASVAFAGVPDRDGPTVRRTPVLDVPIRDASVCRGPGGTFYLTGTTATEGPDGRPDFNNNRGVRVWTSTDLKAWQDRGFVWDLWKDPSNHAHHRGGSAWQTELYPVPGLPPGERARGMTAPRLAHDGERFWITFSMNGYAAGAMPGAADVKGPYVDTLLIAEAGAAPTGKSDASLFVDTDGTRYLIWGGGVLARLKSPDALAKLDSNQTGVESPRHYLPALIQGFPADDGLPDRGAPYGVSLFHYDGRYHFVFAATTLRDGTPHEDSYICHASRLLGPYSKPAPFILDSGRCTVFTGPDGKLRVSYSTSADRAVIVPYPTSGPGPIKPGSPKLEPVEIATTVPPLEIGDKTEDVPQLLDMIEPCLDQPLRDAALCLGPDGTWYLTGTEAALAPDDSLDWTRNRGIPLWSSTDRVNWKNLGYVWLIERDGGPWHKAAHLDLTSGASPRVGRAVTAPELHYLKGTFWIVYSMNGSGIGILRSTSGRPDGPYKDLGRVVAHGRDPSLLEDDGTVYLVWGPGFCMKLSDDLTAPAGPVKTLFTNVAWYPRYMRRAEAMGLWGSRVVKAGPWYVLTFTTRTGRCGINAIDTMASWSKSLDGPWGEPCLMLANGGQSTLVPDGDDGWLATVSGEDEYSQCPFQPAITPVGSGKSPKLTLRPYRPNSHFADFHALNSLQATALDLWRGHPDLIPCALRDVCLIRDPESGAYYCTGSFWGVEQYRRDVVMFRSPDLLHWKPLPPVYSYRQLKDDGLITDVEAFSELIERDREGTNWRFRIQIGEQKIWRLDGHYYMNAQTFCRPGGHFLLKSVTGKVEGPYKGVQEIMGVADLMQNDDRSILFNSSGMSNRYFPDVAAFAESSLAAVRRAPQFPIKSEAPRWSNICFSEDCEAGIMKIAGKYVTWSTDWTGCYDAIYRYADEWKGPYRGKLRILPYGGNGRFFQDEKDNWYYTYFPNSNDYATRAANICRMNMYPLFVGEENGELILEPKALRANRARLEKMGALWQAPRP
jgi:beta-xylosidase